MSILSALQVLMYPQPWWETHNAPQMTRIGPNEDGGYVVPVWYNTLNHFISIGIGNEYRFEEAIISQIPAAHIEMYDGTCSAPSIVNQFNNVMFVNSNVGDEPNEISLRNILLHSHQCCLKMDVEGSEYEIIQKNDIPWKNCSIIIMEFHDLNIKENRDLLEHFITSTLKDTHILFHVHGNSWGGTSTVEVAEQILINNFPNVLELTFVKNDGSEFIRSPYAYPIDGIDYSNNPSVADIKLPWVNIL